MGAAVCATLVLVVTRRAEEKEFLKLAATSRPGWLGLALLLQSATYVMQGLVWKITARAADHHLTLGNSFKLSLASLFADQALPTAGVSGMAIASGALTRRGMSRAGVASAILVNLAMYSFAYACCMAVAAGIAIFQRYLPGWVAMTMLLFVLIRIGMAWFMIALPTGGLQRLRERLRHIGKLSSVMRLLDEADAGSFRDRKLLSQVFALHLTTFLLDAATLWVSVLALGGVMPPGGLFTSFMASTFFRTVGIMPGGLGTFETASVLSLKSIGLPLPIALSATLLFRGFSFWLPMVPGLICARRLLGSDRRTAP